MDKKGPVLLCILDGWGHRAETDHNAIAQAQTPNWDAMLEHYPHGLINASEHEVGLPAGQMGNSEVGHMNIGAGRVVMQDLPRIDAAIADGSLNDNAQLNVFIESLKSSGGACHLLGLLSDGGVHAHQNHMLALAKAVSNAGITVYVHAFLDGRDTPPKSADGYLKTFTQSIAEHEHIHMATLCGRYFAMDRDTRWERVEKAYSAIVKAQGTACDDALDGIARAYDADETDEFVSPYIVSGYTGAKDGDGILMANFRADRAREILHALIDKAFDGFARERTPFTSSLGMVEYSRELAALMPAMFPPETLHNILGEVIANKGMKQLRIAETEKYAHVTFFFNGGREEPYDGEDRILIPSPDVPTYDLKPEMSAPEVTYKLVEAIESGTYPFIVVNYANTDMVGHCGKLDAAIKAVEAVDICLGRLKDAIDKTGGTMLVTADHGNAELMHNDETESAHTAHTLNLVPAIFVGNAFKNKQHPIPEGRLADIAPTLLGFMGIDVPPEMNGQPLISETLGEKAAS